MSAYKVEQLMQELSAKILEVYETINCGSYNSECDGCPLMRLHHKYMNWNGQCLGELLNCEE